MPTLTKKIQVRNGHRIYLRKLFSEINGDLKDSVKIDSLENKQVSIKILDDKILFLISEDEDIITKMEDDCSWDNSVLDNLAKLQHIYQNVKESEPNSSTHSVSCKIDSNENLSNIEKFSYLKSFLSGKAEKVNYKQAVQLLMDRFGNTRSLIAANMDYLRRTYPVESLKHVMQLRRMYNKLEKTQSIYINSRRVIEDIYITVSRNNCFLTRKV